MMTSLRSVFPTATASSLSDDDGVNLLIEMDDGAVRQQVGAAFLSQMQNSPRVKPAFFASAGAPPCPVPDAATNDWVGQLASALIALSLAQTSSHGFAATVNGPAAQSFLTANLTPASSSLRALALANYRALFPTYCQAHGTTFSKFLDGSHGPASHWGSVLAGRLSSAPYINQQMAKLNPAVDPGGWYQVLFANLYKVACLNPGEHQRVVDTWDRYLQGKEVPGIVPWTVYDHMVAASYNYATFMGPVQGAIAVSQSNTRILGCHGGPAASCSTETTTTYGAAVNNWLGQNRGLGGFIHGPSSQSTEGGGGGGGCCFVAGTPILMADGTSVPIERVGGGDRVVSRDGEITPRSPQDVIWPIEAHELLFGINDYPPFFNASHPFMTQDGWKSMSPVASTRMNPDLKVSKLQVGDVVFQVVETQPLRYREVTIEQITRIPAGDTGATQVHSLHLASRNPGYHAHGFLVAVNYPQLREDQFLRAFAGIPDGERDFLLEHVRPLMPFLRRGLGPYVGEILRRALGGTTDPRPLGAPSVTVSRE